MASSAEFVAYAVEQLGGEAREVKARRMFGDYGLYAEGAFCGVICDNALYLKPTAGGRALLSERGQLAEAPAYEGASPSLRIDCIEDCELLSQLLTVTLRELPKKGEKPKRAAKKAEKRAESKG